MIVAPQPKTNHQTVWLEATKSGPTLAAPAAAIAPATATPNVWPT